MIQALLFFTILLGADDEPDKPIKLSDTEQQFLDMTNKAREKENLPPLKLNATLVGVARAHAANMAKQGILEHVLDGKTAAQRVKDAGYVYRKMGENVSKGFNSPLAQIFQGLMDSKGHRENILNKEYLEIGVGFARGKDGWLYYAQVFGTPLNP